VQHVQINWVIPLASIPIALILVMVGLLIHRVFARRRQMAHRWGRFQAQIRKLGLDATHRRLLEVLAGRLEPGSDPATLLRHRATFERVVHDALEQLSKKGPAGAERTAGRVAKIRAALGFADPVGADFVSTRQLARGLPVQISRGAPGGADLEGAVGRVDEDSLEIVDLQGLKLRPGERVVFSVVRDERRYRFDSEILDLDDRNATIRATHSLEIVDDDVRSDQRVPVNRKVGFRAAGDPETSIRRAVLVDISVGGAAIRCSSWHNPGETLELDLDRRALLGMPPAEEPEEAEPALPLRGTIVGSSQELNERIYHVRFYGHDEHRVWLFALVNDLDRERRGPRGLRRQRETDEEDGES
jgi:hypothetical protein